MPRAPEPHVSAALKHLRHGVTAAGVLLALCLIAQTLVWGFVHFTDVRYERLEATESTRQPLTVVNSSGSVITIDAPSSKDAPEVNRVEGPGSVVLGRVSDVVQTVGVISAIALLVLMFQGVVVAGGGHVPGVEQAVTAGTWTLLLTLLALPWSGVLPEMTYPGVFRGYEAMVAASEARRGGAGAANGAFYTVHVVLPLLMLAGIGVVVVRFRMGIEQGVIVTHASQLDEKIEREIRERKLGELSQPRAVGALNQAIGLPMGGGDRSIQMPMGNVTGMPVPAPAPAPTRPHSPMSARPQGEEPPSGPGGFGAPKRPI